MEMINNFLNDKNFLDQLDCLKIKTEFIKITALSWDEESIEEIQGKVINGSLNIDGGSSLRRTANLTMFAEEQENDLSQINNLIAINKKIKLEIGIVNKVPSYTYYTQNSNGLQVPHIVDYQKEYGDIIWFPLGIFVIFDPNISHGLQGVTISLSLKDKMCLLNGDAGGKLPATVYFHERDYEDKDGNVIIEQPTIRQIIEEAVNHFGEENLSKIIISDVDERIKQVVQYIGDVPLYYREDQGQGEVKYSLTKPSTEFRTYEYGDDVGFIYTDFVYPGELIGNVGESITSVLDKIVSVLGNFEYFYDVDGNFHFQEIKNYLNTTYTTEELKKSDDPFNAVEYRNVDLSNGKSVYTFNNSNLISSFANSPKYTNVKNDFLVWGVRTSQQGVQIPIRYHVAIDKKPKYDGTLELKDENGEVIQKGGYGKHQNITLKPDEFGNFYAKSNGVNGGGKTIITKDWREELYYQGVEAEPNGINYPYYYTELKNEFPKIYDLQSQEFKKEYSDNPTNMDFFLDIIDDDAEVGIYNIDNIGRRPEYISDEKINCVFEQTPPDIVFIEIGSETQEADKKECEKKGQVYYQVSPEMYSLFTIGGYQNSCYQRICEMLYLYTHMNNSISISALPIYYLEPNTRITVLDNVSGIFGDYIIKTISLPLDISSAMSISAYKALNKI